MTMTGSVSGRFVREVTRVIAALLETDVSSRPGAAMTDAAFVVTITGHGDGTSGGLRAYFDLNGARALASRIANASATPKDSDVIETLGTICSQAIASLSDQLGSGVTLAVVSVQALGEPPSLPATSVFEIIVAGEEQPIEIGMAGDLELSPGPQEERPSPSQTIDVIMDIDLPLVVRFGRTELPLKLLTALGPGSVIDLLQSPDEPVDVLIGNRVVARGEVVIVSGNYGVRIRDVVSASERALSLEAQLT
jgi:flagellar motor switch protein FliN/FliY